MSRQWISREELRRLINEHLAAQPKCKHLHVLAIAFDQTRKLGSNWKIGWWGHHGSQIDRVACDQAIDAFMRELHAKYDVE
jgi:hypothetical protein